MSVVAGNNNTALGHNAGRLITTGSDNICIGVNAGNGGSQTLTTGSQNTIIGKDAKVSGGGSINSTAIGYQAQVDGNNTIQLGNASVSAVKTNGTLYALGLESIGTNSTLNIASVNNTNCCDTNRTVHARG